VPGLEHLVGPALPVALGGGEAVGRDRERLVVAVGDAQEFAVPHVREAQALVVPCEDSVSVGRCDQLVRRAESVAGVLERALGDAEREHRPSIVRRFDRCTRLLEQRTPLVEATGGDEIVEEAGEVPSAQGLGEVG